MEGLHPQAGGMGLNIRPLGIADRLAVAEIIAESGAFSNEEVRVALEMIDIGLSEGPENSYALFVAEWEGTVSGYICIGATPLTLSTWHVYWISVHPRAQRRGVGRALQAHVEEYVRLRAGERLVVETSGRPDYARSRRFYEKNGYRMSGRIADYYKPGDDCVFYCKVLL
jgi:ribosomal protein S18 acetylase RimI-like enzyme